MAQNMPPADVELDADVVTALLSTQWPGWAEQEVTPVGNGWDNFMFKVGESHVARLPRRLASVELVTNEARWLPRLAPNLPLPVPAPEFLGKPQGSYPWPWTVCPWIPGTSAAETKEFDLETTNLSLASFLRALHRPAPAEAPHNPFRSVPLVDKADQTRGRFELLASQHDLATLVPWWERALELDQGLSARVWIHGDLHPHNIVMESGRPSGVIDFSDLCGGDPSVDLAVIWMLFSPDTHQGFWDVYDSDDPDIEVRTRGWAINQCLIYLAHSADNPVMASVGQRTLAHLRSA